MLDRRAVDEFDIDSFCPPFTHTELARKLIESGAGRSLLIQNLSDFEGLDHTDIALKLIEVGETLCLVRNLSSFEGLDADIAYWLIEGRNGGAVAEHLSNFEGLDHTDIAHRLIETGDGWLVARYLSNFKGVNHTDIAHRLIEEGSGDSVADHLANFKGVDHVDIARRLIEEKFGNAVADYLYNFEGLDADIAHRLIKEGYGWLVAEHLSNFKGVDHVDIAHWLIKEGGGESVIEHLSDFEGLDHTDIAHRLIEKGDGEHVAYHLPKFEDADHTDIAHRLIEEGYGESVARYLSNFKDADHTEIADDLITHDQKWVVVWYAKELGVDVQATEDEYRESFRRMKETRPDLVESTADNFERAADIFGYKNMFRYKEREGLSFHDATYELDGICDLYKLSGLSPRAFYTNILDQVRKDTQEYEEGTAHHNLNAIVTSINTDIPSVIEEARKHRDIERLQELAETLKRPEDVFASWSNLKRYRNLSQLLDRVEILDDLKELKKEGKEDLSRYIETLAFHPDSKVNMQAVLQFWRDPEDFLDAHDVHTPDEVQDRKKPSNYIHIPNLDLTAEDLRDALVEGVLDRITTFPPMEIRYSIPPTREALRQALGSPSKGVKGTAKKPGKLFSEVSRLLKQHETYQKSGVNVNKYLGGEDIPEDLEQQVEELTYHEEFGIQKKTQEYVARITNKSDPEGALAGDDTANCMPYGSGKNTVYTFNPNTAQFIIRRVKKDGTERTVAQSVLTKDSDVRKAVPDIINELQREKKMDDVLPEDVLAKQDPYLACDNIEVAPTYTGEEYEDVYQHIYHDFFKKYTQKEKGFRTDKIVIGTSYADALTNLQKEKNTYVPQAPVGYSDKVGEEVYILPLGTEHTETEKKETGISPLTFEDSLKVAYLESKAYKDNETLIESLFALENALIAKDINNEMKNRPNLSTKYADSTGRMRGYLLAYEGVIDDGNHDYEDKPCIYISDLASDRENTLTGGRLIKEFAKQYKEHYLDKNNPLPIYAQARETTSYRIIKKQIDNLAKQTGTEFELIELPTYEQGGDTMHPVVIQPMQAVVK